MRRNHSVISLHRKPAFQDQISQSAHFPAVLTEKNNVNSCSDFLETKEINLVDLPISLHWGSVLTASGVEFLGSTLAELPRPHPRRLHVHLLFPIWQQALSL